MYNLYLDDIRNPSDPKNGKLFDHIKNLLI